METSNDTGAVRPPGRRRVVIGAVALAVVMASALTVTAWENRDGKPATAGGGAVRVATAVVTRGDLSNAQTLDGTLGYGRTTTVKGGKAGLVTWLPAAGSTVRRGEPLYRVDNVPVPVFYGGTPLYRTLETEGTTGPDVRTVADNLGKLGYDIGAQPPVGTWITPRPATPDDGTSRPSTTPEAGPSPSTPTPSPLGGPVRVRRGDGVLTAGLVAAVKRWQTAAGMPPTGVLGVGDVSVQSGAVRVDGVQAQLADAADAPLMTVTSTVKSVTVEVDPSAAGSMRRGDRVVVSLPDDSTAQGTITAVGTSVRLGDASAGDGAGGQPRLTVRIALRDSTAVRGLNAAPVRVRFTSETRKGVLTVPVGALLALREGGYAVQLPGGRLVAVRTGMFSKGVVEISGDGIGAGTKVVTTS
ncbi:peptidoglycan-binding domain-containing protein [Streptomyces sp. NPDC088921]|uniref:peptidoglycan-binding domain-containing protein n=1 Tax=unclassified Streptomyces TaxID=2593676 RepID=UPI0034156588